MSTGLAPGPPVRVPLRPCPLERPPAFMGSEPKEVSPAWPAVGETRAARGAGRVTCGCDSSGSGLRGEGRGQARSGRGALDVETASRERGASPLRPRSGEQVLEQRPPDRHGLFGARTCPPGAPHSHANAALVPLKGVCVLVRTEPAGSSRPQWAGPRNTNPLDKHWPPALLLPTTKCGFATTH